MILRIQFGGHGSSGRGRWNSETSKPGAPRGEAPLLANSNLSSPYFPTRGFVHSLLIHAIVIGGIILLHPNLLDRPHHPDKAPVKDAEDFRNVIYLPLLQSDPLVEDVNHSEGFRAGKPENRPKESPAASTRGAGSFSYPGPQPILSEFPEPTNRIQTVLQPELENPPVLAPPLLLPNFVQLAEARPEPPMPDPVNEPAEMTTPAEDPPEPTPEPKPEQKPEVKETAPPLPKPEAPPVKMPDLSAAVLKNDLPEIKPVEQVKPTPVPQNASPRSEVKAPEPKPKPVEPKPEPAKPTAERKEPPKPASDQSASVHKNAEVADPAKPGEQKPATKPKEPAAKPAPPPSNKNVDLLALTPMPAQRKPDEIPRGEAHGNFAISPTPNLAASETKPGFNSDKNTAASKTDKPAPAGNVAPEKAPPAAGGGSTTAARSPEADGTRSGSAPGGTGSGAATGSNSARSPFQGITVYGAVDDTGETIAPSSNDETPFSPQKSYGYSIISTEASGGGLPSLGVFSQEQFYTVYLDMRQSALDSAPSWILEYALYGGTNSNSTDDQGRSQQGLVLPFPVTKQNPDLPQDLVRRYLRQLVIVYAVVNAYGKMEQVSITETPDALLNQPVLDALRKWTFRPGQLNGQPVAMKVLVGIPLWPVK